MKNEKLDKLEFLKLLKIYNGEIKAAANNLGVNRSRIYSWIKSDSEFKDKIDTIRSNKLNYIEAIIKDIEII